MVTEAPLPYRARVALEALRTGVTNREVVRLLSYGRDEELSQLERGVLDRPDGSAQVIVGGYGVGKSHLCELLGLALEAKGYAVARLELGASHSRAEYPRHILEAIETSLRVKIGQRTYRGMTDLALLRRAADVRRTNSWEQRTVLESHKLFPGAHNLGQRVDFLRDELAALAPERFYSPYWASSSKVVPYELTAVNRAVAELNRVAHDLKDVGVPGLVVLLDEAERSETLPRGAYRMERARDLILGLATASANQDTRRLKHYRNEAPFANPYLPCGVSRIHTVFAFTYAWGLAADLEAHLGVEPIKLTPLRGADRDSLLERLIELYDDAYGYAPDLSEAEVKRLKTERSAPDVRSTVRTIVAGLDFYRHQEENGRRA